MKRARLQWQYFSEIFMGLADLFTGLSGNRVVWVLEGNRQRCSINIKCGRQGETLVH